MPISGVGHFFVLFLEEALNTDKSTNSATF